tara:strand:+ start:4302 stop:8762 length:4461 start_codon:yes stop_codon:yes gene_type:complete
MAINYCNQDIKGTLTTTGTITSGGSIYVPDYIIHTGDADTKIGFNTNDNVEIRVGGNLQISASSSRAYLRYQGSNKLQTDSAGVNVTGGVTATGNIVLDDGSGASPNIQFQNEDDDSWYIYNDSNGKFQVQQSGTIRATFSSGDLELTNDLKVSGGGITLLGTGRIQGIDTVSAGTDAASKTYVDNAVSGAGSGTYLPLAGGTMTGDIAMGDNDITGLNKITYTDGIELFGASNNNYLKFKSLNANNGGILFQDGDSTIQGYIYYDGGATSAIGFLSGAGEWAVRCIENDAVELRYDNSIKLTTASGGVSITGDVMLDDNEMITWGGNSILQHTGAITYIGDNSSGSVISITNSNTTLAGNLVVGGVDVTITANIIHSGDSNTYFGFNAADTWRVVTGGSQRLEVNNSGVKIGSGARVTTILDEDNMSSDSATALATQQSIKAYVDASTTGVLTYQGTWNADTNSPTLSSGSGTPGYYYIVSVAGSTNLDGITDWAVGDWAVFSDQATDAWQKIDNTAVGNVSGSGVNNRLVLWSGTSTVDSDSDFYVDADTIFTTNLEASGKVVTPEIESSGIIVLDAAGDITLDADGGDIVLKDAGSTFGKITNSSQDLQLWASTSDKDLVFKGYDSGSAVTALTLDMSAAGYATFNSGVTFGGNVTAPAFYISGGTGSDYLDVISNDLYIVAAQKNILYSGGAETVRLETTGQIEFSLYGSQTYTGTSASYLIATSAGDIIEKTPAQVLSDIGAASSGSLGSYLPLAGGTMTGNVIFNDNVGALFGTSSDMNIKHDGSNSKIENNTGHLNITQEAADKDITFYNDDGSGNTTEYFRVDGDTLDVRFSKPILLFDSVNLKLGAGQDLELFHNGTDSYIQNSTGHLYFLNYANDKDIIFKSDDGSGGLATYFYLDGSTVTTVASKQFKFEDGIKLFFGTGADSALYSSSDNLIIEQTTDDKDIKFLCDDGSGGTTEYFRLDGSATLNRFYKNTRFDDNVQVQIGSGADLQIVHNGTDSQINNTTGNLQFTQLANDKDISFASDDGSGGDTIYMTVDGGNEDIDFFKSPHVLDSVTLKIGSASGGDLQIYHNGSHSLISNQTGNLYIRNQTNDGDILLQADDGSGGDTTYIRIDGGAENISIAKNTVHPDSVATYWGDANDLQIYHDSNNSYIVDSGDGNMIIAGDQVYITNAAGSEYKAQFTTDGAVNLYYDNSKKFETTSAGGTLTGRLIISDVPNIMSDPDKFLAVGTDGTVSYRTGSQLLSDIGGGAGTVTSVSVGTGLDITNSTTTPNITMDLTELTLGAGIDSSATGLSLDFSEFGTATTDEVTSFIVYNNGDSQAERLLLADVHDIDAYWKYTPVVFNGAFNDGTSSTSTFYIPIAGSTTETTSNQEYQFAAMPFAGRIRTLMMQNTGTTPTTTNSTRMKIYKNGSLAYTTSYQVPTNGGSVGAYILFDNNTAYTFAAGDRIQFAYNKQFTSDYWRDVAFTAVVEFQQM